MKQIQYKRTAAWGLALLMAAGSAYGADHKADGDRDVDRSDQMQGIEGTWVATVTPPFGAPSFLAYSSYIKGGVFIVSPDRLPPGSGTVIGNAQGSWRAVGDRQFAATHIEFRYGSLGEVVGTAKVRSLVRLISEDSLEGEGQLQLCDAMLQNCSPPAPANALATLKGRRLRAERPVSP